jgi:hypothetical protein
MARPCIGITNQGHAYHEGDPPSPSMSMNRNECAYAAQHIQTFLKQVGPIEAAWAMNTALETLAELPPSNDHVAAVMTALDESLAEFDELAHAASNEPADGGGEALLADELKPKPPAKKTGKAS